MNYFFFTNDEGERTNLRVYSDIFIPYLLSSDVLRIFVAAFDPLYPILGLVWDYWGSCYTRTWMCCEGGGCGGLATVMLCHSQEATPGRAAGASLPPASSSKINHLFFPVFLSPVMFFYSNSYIFIFFIYFLYIFTQGVSTCNVFLFDLIWHHFKMHTAEYSGIVKIRILKSILVSGCKLPFPSLCVLREQESSAMTWMKKDCVKKKPKTSKGKYT